MKLCEILSDWLSNSSLLIVEMAFERKALIRRIDGLEWTLGNHLIKVLRYSSPNNYEHWIREINGYLNEINSLTLKPNRRKLDGQTYYTLLFGDPLEGIFEITNRIQYLDNEYVNVQTTDLTPSQILEILEKIYHTVCFDIANNKFAGDIRKYLPKENII